MPYIKTQSGTNWHYQIKGEGEILLFLHGWSFDSEIWRMQLDFFSKYFKTVTIDFPGHGRTDYQGECDIVEDLLEIIKYLKFDKINLLGHSLGAIFSLKFILKYPKYINKLILAGLNPKYVNSKDYNFGLSKHQIEKLRTMLASEYPEVLLVFRRWLFTPLERSAIYIPSFLTGFVEKERGQSNFKTIWKILSEKTHWPRREALLWLLSIIEQEDFRAELSKIKTPTLIISGTDDSLCLKEAAQLLNEGIKDSRLEFFQDCGHLPFLTHSQKFNQLVKDFLKQNER